MSNPFRSRAAHVALFVLTLAGGLWANDDPVKSPQFQGVKANKGTVTYTKVDCTRTLTLSNDFVVPDTPAPHWQVVDSAGRTYLLQRLKIKGDKVNTAITVPAYVQDVAKVQVWCAFAETLLGETTFTKPVGGEVGDAHKSATFQGVKANKGFVTHVREGAASVLVLSADFVVPDTPAPHWQVVDSKGNVFLLQRLKIKGDKVNTRIVLPDYVQDVVKVQIWCAFAETLLGEASFTHPVM